MLRKWSPWPIDGLVYDKFAPLQVRSHSYQLAHKSFKSFPYQRTTNAQVMHSRFITQVSNEFDIIFVHFFAAIFKAHLRTECWPKNFNNYVNWKFLGELHCCKFLWTKMLTRQTPLTEFSSQLSIIIIIIIIMIIIIKKLFWSHFVRFEYLTTWKPPDKSWRLFQI